MALVSFPTIINTYNNIGGLSHSLPLTSQANSFSHGNLNNKSYVVGYYYSRFLYYPSNHHRKFSPKRTGLFLVPLNANKKVEPEGDDFQALETVLRLYTAIKNKNIRELSDVIGDECQCVCNFFSSFQPFQGKKQVLDFFSYLIRFLGNHIEFVVTPTIHDGMNVGIKWRLECNKTHVPLGKGFSFHMCHVYHGKVVIRNVGMFLEPLLHIGPSRLIIIRYMTSIMDKMSSNQIFRNKSKKATLILLALFIIVALVLLFIFTMD